MSESLRWFVTRPPILTGIAIGGATICLLSGPSLRAQNTEAIPVALTITEPTPGYFRSNFSAALRALGDVEVVGRSDYHRFGLMVVVVCTADDCRNTRDYALSIALTTPITPFQALKAIGDARVGNTVAPAEVVDANRHFESLRDAGLATVSGLWVMSWGTEAYEQAIREFVAELDVRCFESARIMRRAAALGADTAKANRIYGEFDQREDWLC